MSDRKTAADPNFTASKPPSGNEGRLHPGMRHAGYYGPKTPLRSADPGEQADYVARQRAYERHMRDG